jgi:aspartyl aminopeptidase
MTPKSDATGPSEGDLTHDTLGAGFAKSADEMAALQAAGVVAAKGMIAFIDRSPTPYHAVQTVAAQLDAAGFSALDERAAWTLEPGDRRYVIRQGGTIVAFAVGTRSPAEAGFRIIGAHTDSPNLRVKPNPATVKRGYMQLGVETYGGLLLSTWLDRDLSVAGRVTVGTDDGVREMLVDFEHPIARVANLAIHLNRKVNSDGLVLNKQRHMVPMLGVGSSAFGLDKELAGRLGVRSDAVLGYDLCLYDTQKGSIGGVDDAFVFCARLDNLASCFKATEALANIDDGCEATRVIALYDHEEVGSRSAVGAQSTVLAETLQRITEAYPDAGAQAFPRAIAGSLLVSADMAHALHPNYADKHDGGHAPSLNRGMVIKTNVNQSYATSGSTAASFARLCAEAGFEAQHFVTRSDLPCGSTIGPITAARLGVPTVDVGGPMLSMHSCREMAGTIDVHLGLETFRGLFR